jgi:hypothetical protein
MNSVGPSADSGLDLQSGANRLALDPDTARVNLLTHGARPLVAQIDLAAQDFVAAHVSE